MKHLKKMLILLAALCLLSGALPPGGAAVPAAEAENTQIPEDLKYMEGKWRKPGTTIMLDVSRDGSGRYSFELVYGEDYSVHADFRDSDAAGRDIIFAEKGTGKEFHLSLSGWRVFLRSENPKHFDGELTVFERVVTEPVELATLTYAQELYGKAMNVLEYPNGYLGWLDRTTDYYRDNLVRAKGFDHKFSTMVNVASSLADIGIAVMTGGIAGAAKAAAKGAAEAMAEQALDELTGLDLNVSLRDFAYGQADNALTALGNGREEIEKIMECARADDGKITNMEDARSMIMWYYINLYNISTLKMADGLYRDQMNQSPWTTAGDLGRKIVISNLGDKLGKSTFYASGKITDALNTVWDLIMGQALNEHVDEWVREQKRYMDDLNTCLPSYGMSMGIDPDITEQPAWIAELEGNWGNADDDQCLVEIDHRGRATIRVLDPELRCHVEFVGVDGNGRAVFMDLDGDTLNYLSNSARMTVVMERDGDGFWLYLDAYGCPKHGEHRSARQRFDTRYEDGLVYRDWLGHWQSPKYPGTVVDITSIGNGRLHLSGTFGGTTRVETDFDPYDYESLGIETEDGQWGINLFLTREGKLELQLYDATTFDPYPDGEYLWLETAGKRSSARFGLTDGYMSDDASYEGHWKAIGNGYEADLYIVNGGFTGSKMLLTMDNGFTWTSTLEELDEYTRISDTPGFSFALTMGWRDDAYSQEMRLERIGPWYTDSGEPVPGPLADGMVFGYYEGKDVDPAILKVRKNFSEKVKITYSYNHEPKTVTFSTDMFRQDTWEFHQNISELAVLLAHAAYNTRESDAGNEIESAYKALGIPERNIMLFNYRHHPLNTPGFEEENYMEFSIANREMGDYRLLLIVLRGSGEFLKSPDWKRDIDDLFKDKATLMDIEVHLGFYRYMQVVLRGLRIYLDEHPEIRTAIGEHKLKVLITGHSLGGGVSNMLGCYLGSMAYWENYQDSFAGTEDIFVYTYACPRNFLADDGRKPLMGSCKHIFNIVIEDDPVPKVPESGWFAPKWRRFGTTFEYKTTYKNRKSVFDHHEPRNYINAVFEHEPFAMQRDEWKGVIVSNLP